MRRYLTYLITLPLTATALASERVNPEAERYAETMCGGVEPFDTAPDRRLKFGYETNLLILLTKPFISGQSGILSKWHFIDANKTLVAEVSPNATWSDGQRVTAQEAVLGIIAGFRNRPIAKSIRLKNETELPSAETLLKSNPNSVQILGNYRFKIEFEGNVKDVSGIIIDALSENSRINRVWPLRLVDGKRKIDIVGKTKSHHTQDKIRIQPFNDAIVKLVFTKDECSKADYFLSSSLLHGDENDFELSASPDEQALLAIFNPKTKSTNSPQSRRYLAALMRKKLKETTSDLFRPTSKLIQKNEPGYKNDESVEFINQISENLVQPGIIKIRPWTKIPDNWKIKTSLELHNESETSFKFDQNDNSAALLLAVAPVRKGRLHSLENGTTFSEISKNKEIFPQTFAALEDIRRNSNTTLPKSQNLFSELERAIEREASIVPLGRFKITLLSKKTSKLKLSWNKSGEIEFMKRREK